MLNVISYIYGTPEIQKSHKGNAEKIVLNKLN